MSPDYTSLTDQQVRDSYFVIPEILDVYNRALGVDGYHHFKTQRTLARCVGAEWLLIGWPDGTTITYSVTPRGAPLDTDKLLQIYRANAVLHRIARQGKGD